jgi:protein tyrosine phosphatase (PTP) superfamily phosphohydrolase (DUF442 family)
VHGRIRINEQMTTGRQPTEEDLEQLAREGFESVANLYLPHEEDQPLSPDYEGIKVRELDMQYLHIPVSTRDLKVEQVDRFRQELPRLPLNTHHRAHRHGREQPEGHTNQVCGIRHPCREFCPDEVHC